MISFKQLGAQGRLGNQLWQIAATIACAKKNNTDYVFPEWEYEQYFNLKNCFSNNIPNFKTYLEPFFHYKELPNETNLNLSGYYQSYKYFEIYKDYIKSKFEFSFNVGRNLGITSIHCRFRRLFAIARLSSNSRYELL